MTPSAGARSSGRIWTLNEIQHEIIRRDFHEPRIHFAVVCAAMGCPPLRAEAYTGKALDRQLDEQTQAFLLESGRFDVEFTNYDWSLNIQTLPLSGDRGGGG